MSKGHLYTKKVFGEVSDIYYFSNFVFSVLNDAGDLRNTFDKRFPRYLNSFSIIIIDFSGRVLIEQNIFVFISKFWVFCYTHSDFDQQHLTNS